MTCRQLQTQATKLAGYLVRNGIKKEDKIDLFGPNTLEWVIAELAIIITGGVVVHVPFRIINAKNVYEIVPIAEYKAFIIDPGKRDGYLQLISQLNAHIAEQSNASALLFLRKNAHLTSHDDLHGVLQLEKETS